MFHYNRADAASKGPRRRLAAPPLVPPASPRPSVAADQGPVSDLGLRDHAAADDRPRRRAVLPALPAALSIPARPRGRRILPRAGVLVGPRLLPARASSAPGGPDDHGRSWRKIPTDSPGDPRPARDRPIYGWNPSQPPAPSARGRSLPPHRTP